jgi:hypothetical protein
MGKDLCTHDEPHVIQGYKESPLRSAKLAFYFLFVRAVWYRTNSDYNDTARKQYLNERSKSESPVDSTAG